VLEIPGATPRGAHGVRLVVLDARLFASDPHRPSSNVVRWLSPGIAIVLRLGSTAGGARIAHAIVKDVLLNR